jgi:hypothetical protein
MKLFLRILAGVREGWIERNHALPTIVVQRPQAACRTPTFLSSGSSRPFAQSHDIRKFHSNDHSGCSNVAGDYLQRRGARSKRVHN